MDTDRNEGARLDSGVALSGLNSLCEALAKKGVIDATDLEEIRRVMVARAERSDASENGRAGIAGAIDGAFGVHASKLPR
jgi:hypothetical protein